MLNRNTILQSLLRIKIDNSIEVDSELLDAKVNLIYDVCKDLTNEQFEKATLQIINSGLELYGKLPKASLFLEYAGKKQQSPERQAIIEVARILDYASFYLKNDVIFDNEFTNETVKKYGGMSKIAWEIDKANYTTPRPREWITKDLKELWLACYDGNHGSNEKNLGSGMFKTLDFVGDKNTCLMLMNKTEDKPLNLNAQQRTLKLVTNLAKGFKSA